MNRPSKNYMDTRLVLLITGTRRGDMNRHQEIVWEKIRAEAKGLFPHQILIVHGGCRGVDKVASIFARRHNVPELVFPYQSELGKAGGPCRNRNMAWLVAGASKKCRVKCLAFPASDCKSTGTRGCIREVTNQGIEVDVTELEVFEHV